VHDFYMFVSGRKQHTHFAREHAVEDFRGSIDEDGGELVCIFSCVGDVIEKAFVSVQLLPGSSETPKPIEPAETIDPVALHSVIESSDVPWSDFGLQTVIQDFRSLLYDARTLSDYDLVMGLVMDTVRTLPTTPVAGDTAEAIERLRQMHDADTVRRFFRVCELVAAAQAASDASVEAGGERTGIDVRQIRAQFPDLLSGADPESSSATVDLADVFSEVALYLGGDCISSFTDQHLRETLQSSGDAFSKSSFYSTMLSSSVLYIPMLFFSKRPFPVAAIQFQQLEVRVTLKPGIARRVKLLEMYTTYVYLSTAERDLFLKKRFDIILPVFETIEAELPLKIGDLRVVPLDFQKPSTRLVWGRGDRNRDYAFEIWLNQERYGVRDEGFYSLAQPWRGSLDTRANCAVFFMGFGTGAAYQPSGFVDFRELRSKLLIVTKTRDNDIGTEPLVILSFGITLLRFEKGFAYVLA
jgi:hypothetical protein